VVTESKKRDSEMDSMATTWEMEREASRSTTTSTELESAACCLLEKLSKRVPSTRKRTALALHGIIRVIAIVEALPQLWVGQYFVGFIHDSHLSFTATLIGMCSECGFAATVRNDGVSREVKRGMRNKYSLRLLDRLFISIP
jgi:hypothetical protein